MTSPVRAIVETSDGALWGAAADVARHRQRVRLEMTIEVGAARVLVPTGIRRGDVIDVGRWSSTRWPQGCSATLPVTRSLLISSMM